MKLLLTHELHVLEHQDKFYNPDGVIHYGALCNYLHTIKQGLVVLRCRPIDTAGSDSQRVDGPGIEVCPIPEFGRSVAMLKDLPRIIYRIYKAIDRTDCYVVRLPGPTGVLVAFLLMLRGKRYGVELVGHYDEDLNLMLEGKGLRCFGLRLWINRLVAFVVRRAAAVAYRSNYLRKLYPTFRRDREFIFSGVQLREELITGPRTVEFFRSRPLRIVSIGRISIGKGYPLLVAALARLRDRTGWEIEMEIIGDGDEMGLVRREIDKQGLKGIVSTPGRIPWGPELFQRLDNAHLFVLASESDGLPRSLVEAMARGMAAISTTVGGIPELLAPEDLVPPGDETALVEKMASVLASPQRLAEMSARNFEGSKEHWPEALNRAKNGFWNSVRELAG